MKNRSLLKVNYLITILFVCLPFLGFMMRGNFFEVQSLDTSFIISSIRVSLETSLVSMLIVVVVGLPAGYYMSKIDFKYKSIVDLLLNLPQVLPPAVIGLLLLLTFGNNGFIGSRLPISMSFSRLSVIITFIFVALPIFVKGVSVSFSEVDSKLEQTASILGDNDLQVFQRVSYPLAKNGIVVSLMMSWSRGISEFGATMMFAGNLTRVTQTLPLAIFTALESNLNNALLLSFIMFVISLLMLSGVHLLMRRRN